MNSSATPLAENVLSKGLFFNLKETLHREIKSSNSNKAQRASRRSNQNIATKAIIAAAPKYVRACSSSPHSWFVKQENTLATVCHLAQTNTLGAWWSTATEIRTTSTPYP